MIRVLRHIALRLWLLLLWGIPAGLWLLPGALALLPDLPAGMLMMFFLAAGGVLQGLVLDLAGRRRIRGLVREGALWEQAGIRSRAEERYLKAVRVFDSILISPWAGRNLSVDLTRVMAGFYLTGEVASPGFRQAAARHLLCRPEDETLAMLWLDRYLGESQLPLSDGLDNAVLSVLADAHCQRPRIAQRLAVPFLEQERADVTARRLYRSVLTHLDEDSGAEFPQAYREKMTSLLGSETSLAKAGQNLVQGTDVPAQDEPSGETLADQVFGAGIRGEGSCPEGTPAPARDGGLTPYAGKVFKIPATALVYTVRSLFRGGFRAGTGSVILVRDALSRLNEKGTVKRYAKVLGMSVLTVWAGFFLWTSLAHVFKTTGTKPVVHSVGQVSGAFTIQVAAYLKQSHADRYLEKLRNRGVAAHVKKAQGGGKTWFLVRVSYFKTKEEAGTFGRKLKAEGKIDDFFVSNI